MVDTLLAVRGIENLSPSGRRATVDVARSLGFDPDYLATVMSFESAGSFDPKKKNVAGSGATGLIQFMPSTAERLGYTTAQLATMSQEEQIRGPVWKYFSTFGKLSTLDHVYLAVFYPKFMYLSDDTVVATAGDGSKVFEQNAGFSQDGNTIRRADIVRTIRSVYNAAQGKSRVTVPDAPGLWRNLLYLGLFGAASYGVVQWGLGRRLQFGRLHTA